MANQSQHAGTIADPIPQRLLYKKGDKVYTVATGPSTSGPTTDVVEATDTRKGITRLSDAIDSDSNAATGVTAATPLAVKYVNDKVTAVEEKNAEQDQRLTAIENKNLDTDQKLSGIEETLTDHAGRIDALENAGGGSTIVLVPRITSPAQNEVNVLTTFTITGSPYQTLLEGDKRKHRVFELSKSKSFDSLVWTKSVDADSAEVTPPVDESTDFYIRIKDESQQGYTSPWSTVTKITSGGPTKVSNPTVSISGDAQAAKANPTFTGSEFAIEPSDQNDPSEHVSTTWTLRKIDGNLLVWQSTDDIINKTSLTLSVGTLNVSTKYKMEMQYTSKSHGSSAVATVEFTTAAEFTKVKTPTVSIEGGADTVYETPVIKGGDFATTVVEDVDTHKSSTWWITKKVGGAEVFRLDNSTDALTSVTVPKGKLEVSTQYVAHVIYTGTTYGASAEATLEFTTADEFKRVETPTIEIAGGTTATSTKPTFNGSSFTVVPNDPSVNHTSTTWWITRASGEEVHRTDKSQTALTVFTCPITLDATQTYVVHAIYHTDTFGDSAEGSLEFTTSTASTGIRTPVIKIEDGTGTAEAYQIGTVFELDEAIDFAKPTEIVANTDWAIFEDSTKIWSKKNTKLWKFLSYIPAQLKPSTKYKVRVRQQVGSAWSDYAEKYFTTAATLNYPPLRFKMKTKVNIQKILGDINPVEYDFFIDDAPSEELKNKWNQDVTLSESGQWVKLVHTSKIHDYPKPAFAGRDGSLKGLLLEVDVLPFFKDTAIGGVAEDVGAQTRNTPDAYGVFSECTGLTQLPQNVFKYHINVDSAGGTGGDAGAGATGGTGGVNGEVGQKGDNGSGNGGNGYGVFYNCTSLTSLPNNLFKYCELQNAGGSGGSGGSGGWGGWGGHGSSGKGGNAGTTTGSGGTGGDGGNGSGNGGNGYGAFYNCTNLASLPNDLFKYSIYLTELGGISNYVDACGADGGPGGDGGDGDLNTGGTGGGGGGDGGNSSGVGGNGYGAFYNCTGLTSLPNDLFKYCKSLMSIGAKIVCNVDSTGGTGGDGGKGQSNYGGGGGGGGNAQAGSRVTISNGYGAFYNCTNLSIVPQSLLKHNVNLYFVGNDKLIHKDVIPLNQNGNGDGGRGSFSGIGGGGATSISAAQAGSKGGSGYDWYGGGGGGGGGGGSSGIGTVTLGEAYGAFVNCKSLTSLHAELFKNCPKLRNVGVDIFTYESSSYVAGGRGGFGGIGGGGSRETSGNDGPAAPYTLTFPTELYGAFGKCSKLTVDLTLAGTTIGAVGNLAKETAAKGTVRVMCGSATATAFKNDPSSNVNVIEEDMA